MYQNSLSHIKRDSLNIKINCFCFLEKINIPWNNNNAEHAIKPFAKWRKRNTVNLSTENIQNHLIIAFNITNL